MSKRSITDTWTAGCPADLELEKLLAEGKIQNSESPKNVYNRHKDIFGSFSLDVFRNHLWKKRTKRGETLAAASRSDVEAAMVDPPEPSNNEHLSKS